MKRLLAPTLVVALLASPVNALTQMYYEPSWRPIIMLAGDGDIHLAQQRLDKVKKLQSTLLHHTRYDEGTQQFLEQFWSSVEQFDLDDLYRMLPEQQDGYRSLNVSGQWKGDHYLYRSVTQGSPHDVSTLQIGDSHISVRARQLRTLGNHDKYLLQTTVDAGIAASNWQSLQKAGIEILEYTSKAPNNSLGQDDAGLYNRMRSEIRTHNPFLEPRDVEFLLPLWRAYPNLSRLITSYTRIDDVLMESQNERGYREYRFKIRLDELALRSSHPALARYLDKLNDLLQAKIEISDDAGTLMTIKLDSQQRTMEFNTVLLWGGIVPQRDGKLLFDRIRKPNNQPAHYTARVDALVDLLGVKTRISNLQTQIEYLPSSELLQLRSSTTKVPAVEVSGAFLNVVPTAMIDMFIPSNIAGIVTEFLQVACEGNEQRGISVDISLHNTQSQQVTLGRFAGSVTALDNSMVQLGLSLMNQRLVPDDSASRDIQNLFFSTQSAFYDDFALYLASLQP